MKPEANWPESWKASYKFDLLEIYGSRSDPGYASAYAARRDVTLELVRNAVPTGARILDVAAAQGNFTIACARMGYAMTWNDLRADLADYVRLKDDTKTIDYRPGNVFELGLEASFDAVIITEIIEHVAHPDQFLGAIAGLVRPGGHIIMTTPNGGYFRFKLPRFSDCPDPSVYESMQFKPDSDGHIFLLHVDEIQSLARKCGLALRELLCFSNPLTSGHVKLWHLLKVLPWSLVRLVEKAGHMLPGFISRRIHAQIACVLQKPA